MPDFKTNTKIAVLIEKINYLFNSVQQSGGLVNKIDKDLMMNYVRELYELTMSLQVDSPQQQQQQPMNPYGQQPNYHQPDMNGMHQQPNPYQQQAPQQQQQVPQQQVPQQHIPQQNQQQQQVPQQQTQHVPYQNGSHPANGNVNGNGSVNGNGNMNGNGNGNYVPNQPENPAVVPGHSINQAYSTAGAKKTLTDMYTIKTGAEKPSVNEKLNQPKTELADKLKKAPIKDLKVFIGLNKRFSYINFLFANDARLYDEAIEKINGGKSYGEVMKYIETELLPKLKWKADDEMVVEFYNIIERRFLA